MNDSMIKDRELAISFGNSCNSLFWKNGTITFAALISRLQNTLRTAETAAEYRQMKKPDKDATKDKGGFVGGHLKDGRRKMEKVICRSMLTLDSDDAGPGFIDHYTENSKYASCLYTTHGHTPQAPRCRIIIPLTRDVTPDEFVALSRYYAAEWGIDKFDVCSHLSNQLMYWPTTPADGEFICKVIEGDWLDPDTYLTEHPNWRDFSTLPVAAKEEKVRKTSQKRQADPLTKKGTVRAFCAALGIDGAISTYLSDIYEPSVKPDRYDYIPGEGTAGVVIYDDKFAYSHHATDPACGKLLNAFDLVRVHLFGDEDEKESFRKMCELAMTNPDVKAELFAEKQKDAITDFGDEENWKAALTVEKNGTISNTLHNALLIMKNDIYMKNIVFNQLADGMEIKGEVPWQHPARFWRDADDAQLICYVDEHYGTFSARNYDIAVTKATDDRSYHPIREYFDSLPKWDGIPRVDSFIIDYLGAENNEYTRAVSRKTLCAAHERIYRPGIKFDYLPVLVGPQGIGKSTLIAKLGMEWFSDSLCLSDMNDKTAAEKLQGYWIMEIGELAGMKKADIDKVKAFASRQDDKYRASFGKRVTPHPRQCVFFGTTNSDNGYLRDVTGNRRYWNINVSGNGKYKPWDMTQETVNQIWAETVVLCERGEELFLPPKLEAYAREEQRMAMERDDREGLVQEYLDMLLPDNWDAMDIYERRSYIHEPKDPTRPIGTHRRSEVSNIEIWSECFGKPKEDMKSSDSYSISAILARLPGWTKSSQRKRITLYGQQRVYVCDNPAVTSG